MTFQDLYAPCGVQRHNVSAVPFTVNNGLYAAAFNATDYSAK